VLGFHRGKQRIRGDGQAALQAWVAAVLHDEVDRVPGFADEQAFGFDDMSAIDQTQQLICFLAYSNIFFIAVRYFHTIGCARTLLNAFPDYTMRSLPYIKPISYLFSLRVRTRSKTASSSTGF
jgi:hypothetical protein